MRFITASRSLPRGSLAASASSRDRCSASRCSNECGSDRFLMGHPRRLETRAVSPAVELGDDLLVARPPRLLRLPLVRKLSGQRYRVFPGILRYLKYDPPPC